MVSTVSASDSISVASPGDNITAGDTFTVEWTYSTDDPTRSEGTTGDLYPFQIHVRTCGQGGVDCGSGGCGSSTLHNLCDDADTAGTGVCMDSDGSVDVTMPSTTSAGEYTLRVTYVGPTGTTVSSATLSEDVFACSTAFNVTDPAIAPGSAYITSAEVDAPVAGFEPGDAFTARWDYDDGDGNGAGSFDVNLNSCEDGACDDGR